MTDTHGTINAKGLDGTAFDEDTLSEHFNRVGTHVMAIVDLQVIDKSGPNIKGKRKVTYAIGDIEVASDDVLAEHLRELQRTVYLNRQHTGAQRVIGEELSDEPTVEGVVAAGVGHRPHPFLPVDASQDNSICDVCGLVESTPRHSVQDTLPDPDEDSDEDSNDEGEGEDQSEDRDPYDDVHAKRGEVTVCGLGTAIGKSLRRHEDTDQVTCSDCLTALEEATGEEPWEYEQPEGTPAVAINPFATAPDPDAA